MSQTLYIKGDATRIYHLALCRIVTRAVYDSGYSVGVFDTETPEEELFVKPGKVQSVDYLFRRKPLPPIQVRLKWKKTPTGFIVLAEEKATRNYVQAMRITGHSLPAKSVVLWRMYRGDSPMTFHSAAEEAIGVMLLGAMKASTLRKLCQASWRSYATPVFESLEEGWRIRGDEGEYLIMEGVTNERGEYLGKDTQKG